jgi:hypothetical protein
VNKADCDRLAVIIGDGELKGMLTKATNELTSCLGCTAKAITHRVQKFRDAASQLGLGDGSTLPATPATGKKRARKTTNAADQDADGVEATPTKTPRTPKTKKKAADVGNDDGEVEETIKAEGE